MGQRKSVDEPATLWALRRIGQNYPCSKQSIFSDEIEDLRGNDPEFEMVRITITKAEKPIVFGINSDMEVTFFDQDTETRGCLVQWVLRPFGWTAYRFEEFSTELYYTHKVTIPTDAERDAAIQALIKKINKERKNA